MPCYCASQWSLLFFSGYHQKVWHQHLRHRWQLQWKRSGDISFFSVHGLKALNTFQKRWFITVVQGLVLYWDTVSHTSSSGEATFSQTNFSLIKSGSQGSGSHCVVSNPVFFSCQCLSHTQWHIRRVYVQKSSESNVESLSMTQSYICAMSRSGG